MLFRSTINVPGLGDVTPSEITAINNQLSSQQLEIDALETITTDLGSDITAINSQIDALDTRTTDLEAEIITINSQLSSQQLDIDSLEIRTTDLEARPTITVRTGIIGVSAGTSSLNITFTELPNSSYGVSIIPVGTSTPRANMGSYVLQTGQTTTGFTILVADNPATVTNLRWTAIHTS